MSRSTEHTKVIESTGFEIPPIPLDIEHMSVEFRSNKLTKVIESTDFEIPPIPLDIEHMSVENDPRKWSAARKVESLVFYAVLNFECVARILFWY